MTNRNRILSAAAVLVAVGITSTAATASNLSFPGLPWTTTPGGAVSAGQAASVGGATLTVNAVYGDPVQTTVSYALKGEPADGQSGSIVPGTRLVLSDGKILNLTWNATDPARPGVGTMIFPGLPSGDHDVSLEVDGITFASRSVSSRLALRLHVDNRGAYRDSRNSQQVFQFGSAERAITVRSVVRTPMAVVVEGTFDGLSKGAIQSFGRPDVWLVDSEGSRVLTDSGRLGYGGEDRNFQFHFPATKPGLARLEFAKFPATGGNPAMEIVVP